MKTLFRKSLVIISFSLCLFSLSIQAQETDAQKMLLDSIEFDKLDIAGVKAALDKGADPNQLTDKGRNSVLATFTMVAPHVRTERAEERGVEILQMLFGAGAKLHPCDQDVLYSPIAHGWALFTEILLKNGASPTIEIDGETPMEIAAEYGQAKSIKLLRKYGVPALENNIAAQRRFITAVGERDIPAMKEAIRNGADVNEKNRQGETALIKAVGMPDFDNENYATVQYLLKNGADPKVQGESYSQKTTALHCAIFSSSFIFGDKKIINERQKERQEERKTNATLTIELLLRAGALVSAHDGDGKTPLHIAAESNNVVGARMLIQAGSKIMPKDNKGKTPLDYAESAEMIKLLKDHGAREE